MRWTSFRFMFSMRSCSFLATSAFLAVSSRLFWTWKSASICWRRRGFPFHFEQIHKHTNLTRQQCITFLQSTINTPHWHNTSNRHKKHSDSKIFIADMHTIVILLMGSSLSACASMALRKSSWRRISSSTSGMDSPISSSFTTASRDSIQVSNTWTSLMYCWERIIKSLYDQETNWAPQDL